MFGIGMQELAVILLIALLVFGPKRLPELARSLGRGLAEFRRASSDLRQSLSEAVQEPRAGRPTGDAGVESRRESRVADGPSEAKAPGGATGEGQAPGPSGG